MRKLWVIGALGALALTLNGCGGSSSAPVYDELSNLSVDASISYNGTGSPVISPASVTRDIQIGVDAGGTEYRGFLDFPLQGKIPYTANVQLAYVEVFVASVPYGSDVPVLAELVDFPLPLLDTDYFRQPPSPYLPPVLGIPIFNFHPSDAVIPRPAIRIEVTSLVRAALQGTQPDFQIRLLLDPLVSGPGIVQLDDDSAQTAPLLHIEYL